MTERTTSSNWALSIVRALEMSQVDCRKLFAELGMDYQALTDQDARFSQDGMTRLWRRAVELSGNPAIGLELSRSVRPGSFHVVGYALMSSSTLLDGLLRLVRYQRIIAEGADLQLRREPCGYVLRLRIHGDQLPAAAQGVEAAMAYALAFCRWICGGVLSPLAVSFEHGAPADLLPYQQLFAAPLTFSAQENAMVFARQDIEAALPLANEALAQLHDRFAGDYLARFSSNQFTHQVRQVVCRLLPQGEPKREVVAQTLLVSIRTLQRRLQDEQTSYQQLLDDCRRELALQYIARPDLALLEVAYLLGFSDPSNFFRAFRRWFDCTPGEYRARS
jgi:AraC-like DNA-binding protein